MDIYLQFFLPEKLQTTYFHWGDYYNPDIGVVAVFEQWFILFLSFKAVIMKTHCLNFLNREVREEIWGLL